MGGKGDSMKRYLILYFATLLTMLPIDALFLGTVGKKVFSHDVGSILSANPNMSAAALFYVLYVVGIVVFASATAADWKSALLYGALFGFMAYMTFELTNRAIIEGWTWKLVAFDLAWGTFVTGLAATVGWLAANHFGK